MLRFRASKTSGLGDFGIWRLGFEVQGFGILGSTLPETYMETQKGPIKTTVPLKETLWVSMLVRDSVKAGVLGFGGSWAR